MADIDSPTSIHIPPGTVAISIRALTSFTGLVVPSAMFLQPAPGTTFEELGPVPPLVAGGYSFLLEHPMGKRLVWDLGIRKAAEKQSPVVKKMLEHAPYSIDRDVSEQLQDAGIDLTSIDTVIWSHSHVDHCGDPGTFPASVSLTVGPGTPGHVLPGYPADPESQHLEADFAGREIREIKFGEGESALRIGGFAAYDYFGDGSLFLLDTPGHCVGHLVALVRTTVGPTPTFALLGGDIAHHPAQLRPAPHKPLPEALKSRIPPSLHGLATDGEYVTPFLGPPDAAVAVHADTPRAAESTRLLRAFDGHPDVFIVLAHDYTLAHRMQGLVNVNGWKEAGWKEEAFWRFLQEGGFATWWNGKGKKEAKE